MLERFLIAREKLIQKQIMPKITKADHHPPTGRIILIPNEIMPAADVININSLIKNI